MTIFGLSVEPANVVRFGMRILIVEDEKKTSSFVRKALQAEGYAVDVLHRGDEGLAAALITPFDALVLDIMLPGRDGLSIVKQLRERGNNVPVLLLSAQGLWTSASRDLTRVRMIICPSRSSLASWSRGFERSADEAKGPVGRRYCGWLT